MCCLIFSFKEFKEPNEFNDFSLYSLYSLNSLQSLCYPRNYLSLKHLNPKIPPPKISGRGLSPANVFITMQIYKTNFYKTKNIYKKIIPTSNEIFYNRF